VLLTARVATYVYVEPDTRVRLDTVICSLSTKIVNGVAVGGAEVSVTVNVQDDGQPSVVTLFTVAPFACVAADVPL
jgi:hypothetical protein